MIVIINAANNISFSIKQVIENINIINMNMKV